MKGGGQEMAVMDTIEIMKLLMHRYPFLLVDRIIECDDEKRIVGLKNVTVNEPFFPGHFPGRPVMPGVLQLEAMAQTGGILMCRIGGTTGLPYFMSIDQARFRRVVVPGDQLRIEVEMLRLRSRSAKFQGKVFVDDELASEAQLMCMLAGDQEQA
jgi:beta-hydroxyacyl-ACP dehydratase FabZ